MAAKLAHPDRLTKMSKPYFSRNSICRTRHAAVMN